MTMKLPEVRLADAVTHLLLALIFVLHVDTGQYAYLMEFTYVFSLLIILSSVLVILYKTISTCLKLKSF